MGSLLVLVASSASDSCSSCSCSCCASSSSFLTICILVVLVVLFLRNNLPDINAKYFKRVKKCFQRHFDKYTGRNSTTTTHRTHCFFLDKNLTKKNKKKTKTKTKRRVSLKFCLIG